MSSDELKVFIKEAIREAYPKEWLSREEVMSEFGIESTTLWKAMNEPIDPLAFSSVGSKKKLFHRNDINTFLQKRKRNG